MAMKKKMLPPILIPINTPLLLTSMLGFLGIFPGIAIAYCNEKRRIES